MDSGFLVDICFFGRAWEGRPGLFFAVGGGRVSGIPEVAVVVVQYYNNSSMCDGEGLYEVKELQREEDRCAAALS